MPDGKRRRRHSSNVAKRTWYAAHRSRRFRRRFGWPLIADDNLTVQALA